MCVQHILLTDGSKIKKYGIRVVPSAIMFRASFVKIGSAVETRATTRTKPTWRTHKDALFSCSTRELCFAYHHHHHHHVQEGLGVFPVP